MVTGHGSTVWERVDRYGVRTVAPVRQMRAQMPAVGVDYGVKRMHLRVNPRLLSYWIPFLAGVAVLIGGMKTAAVPLVSVPQLLLGVVLIAYSSWEFVSDFGLLDFRSRAPLPLPPGDPVSPPSVPVRKTYDETFRRHAVDVVRSTGRPVAAVASELDVNPSTLAGWVRKDRQERQAPNVVKSD